MFDFRNFVGRESALPRVFKNHIFVGRDVDAIDLVLGYVAVHPLDFGPEII